MSKHITVLYVEDEPNLARLLSSGLRLFGINVLPVFISAEAMLEQIDSADYANADILIFDIRLPRMTGYELASELRQRGEKRPIVLVSAWPAPAKEQMEQIDATFLPKPFDFPDVVDTIQELKNRVE